MQRTRNHANNNKGEVRHSQITQRLLQLRSLGRLGIHRTTGQASSWGPWWWDGELRRQKSARERETNIQIGLLGQEFLRRKAATDCNNKNKKKEKKKQRRPTDWGPPLWGRNGFFFFQPLQCLASTFKAIWHACRRYMTYIKTLAKLLTQIMTKASEMVSIDVWRVVL